MKKTYYSYDESGMTVMRGRSRQATALGFHNSPGRARAAYQGDQTASTRRRLQAMNRDAVRELAKEHEIPGRGRMTKDEMVEALVPFLLLPLTRPRRPPPPLQS